MSTISKHRCTIAVVAIPTLFAAAIHAQTPWTRHVIDAGPKGADGVRFADANGDGALDVVTGWEQSGKIRLCINPGRAKVRERWRAVEVGAVASPEDAVVVDLDGDGAADVVSSCEGKCKTMYVHWGPRDRTRLLNAQAWKTEAFPATTNKQMWMFATPAQIDGKHGTDLFVGSKGENGSVSWLQAPADPRDLKSWQLHPLRPAGWIMSLIARDLDGDGDLDVVFSDRKGTRRGVFWLEHPGAKEAARAASWKEHAIGALDEEVMFIDLVDINADGRLDVIATAKPRKAYLIHQPKDPRTVWAAESFDLLGETGRAKSIRAADIDLDGKLDLVFTCEGATGSKSGVSWYRADAGRWVHHDISGTGGEKFDLVELLDLDGDGDLDLITTEENDNLGVIWYENPTRGAPGG